MSSASASLISQLTFGTGVVVFLNISKTPLIKLAKPLCSLSFVSLAKSLIFIIGFFRLNAFSTNSPPFSVNPVLCLIISAILFPASKSVWKYLSANSSALQNSKIMGWVCRSSSLFMSRVARSSASEMVFAPVMRKNFALSDNSYPVKEIRLFNSDLMYSYCSLFPINLAGSLICL